MAPILTILAFLTELLRKLVRKKEITEAANEDVEIRKDPIGFFRARWGVQRPGSTDLSSDAPAAPASEGGAAAPLHKSDQTPAGPTVLPK